MKYGIRKPSIKKRIAARASWKLTVRHNLRLKAPKGYGWLTNPRKAAYYRIYGRTTKGCGRLLSLMILVFVTSVIALAILAT